MLGPEDDPHPIHASIITPGPSPTATVTESPENVLQGIDIIYIVNVCINVLENL